MRERWVALQMRSVTSQPCWMASELARVLGLLATVRMCVTSMYPFQMMRFKGWWLQSGRRCRPQNARMLSVGLNIWHRQLCSNSARWGSGRSPGPHAQQLGHAHCPLWVFMTRCHGASNTKRSLPVGGGRSTILRKRKLSTKSLNHHRVPFFAASLMYISSVIFLYMNSGEQKVCRPLGRAYLKL